MSDQIVIPMGSESGPWVGVYVDGKNNALAAFSKPEIAESFIRVFYPQRNNVQVGPVNVSIGDEVKRRVDERVAAQVKAHVDSQNGVKELTAGESYVSYQEDMASLCAESIDKSPSVRQLYKMAALNGMLAANEEIGESTMKKACFMADRMCDEDNGPLN